MARTKSFDRQQKLVAAMELFWHRGYAQTSVAELVKHLGINRFSLYNAYGDKQSLYREALNFYLEQVSGPIIEQLFQQQAGYSELTAFLSQFVRLQRQQRCGCFMQNAILERSMSDQDVLVQADRFFALLQQAFCQVLSNAINAGDIGATVDPVKTARFLVMQLQGIRVLGKSQQYQIMDDGVAVMFDFINGLKQ